MSESRTSEAQVSVFAIGQFGPDVGDSDWRGPWSVLLSDRPGTKFDYFLFGGLALAVGSWVLSTVLGLYVMSCPLL